MTFVRLARHVAGQLVRGRRLYGMVALSAIPGLIAWIAGGGESVSDKLQIYDDVIANLSGITLSIAVLVLGVAAMRDEQDGGTLPFLYLSPIARWRFAVASWVGASSVALLVAVGGWTIGWLGVGMSTGEWTHPLAVLPAYLAAALGYTAIFLPVGYLFKRATLAGLAYVFVWERILTRVMSGLAPSSIWRTALSIFGGIRDLSGEALEALESVAPSVSDGVLKMAVTIVVGLAVFTWALRTRDAL